MNGEQKAIAIMLVLVFGSVLVLGLSAMHSYNQMIADMVIPQAFGESREWDEIMDSMDITIDVMACSGASEGLGTYEEYSTTANPYTKERCDYLMQKYDKQCETLSLTQIIAQRILLHTSICKAT